MTSVRSALDPFGRRCDIARVHCLPTLHARALLHTLPVSVEIIVLESLVVFRLDAVAPTADIFITTKVIIINFNEYCHYSKCNE